MSRLHDFEVMLIRHGDAQDWSDQGDAQRALTPAGIQALERCVPCYEHFDWGWSKALVSPYLRALQTAQVFHKGLAASFERSYGEPLPAPLTEPLLLPEAPVAKTARRLLEVGQALAGPRPRVALFGHNPNLSALASLLLWGEHTPPHAQLSLGRGDMLHLFLPAPSPFDTLLSPLDQEPLPQAILLGFYTRGVLELGGH